ncbi:MAG: FAD-dependent oxidoreductase [Candidatus Omnitrophica bacterium]|nr:FAD-dependent oxidoreductase [Candidatus Omnitrophota bacterium]
MSKIYDLIILGAGPAGITAAVYAVRKRLNFLIISFDIGGQTAWSGDIENYTGYQFITGPELTLKFQKHMESFGTKTNIPETVKDLKKEGDRLRVITDKAEYISRMIIVATGKKPRMLNVPGEEEYKNKGVTYCATCDGPVFKDKSVAIIGGGNSALEAALQMIKISPKVHIVNIGPKLTGDPIMIEKLDQSQLVEIHNNAQMKKIYGETFVKGIEFEQQGRVVNLELEGVFIEVGLAPNVGFAGILKKNQKGEIIVDQNNKTNIEGVFAAGDVTDVPEKQIIIACGEGSKACLSAFKYISTH